MAQVDGMLRRVLTLPRSASADGYDEQPPLLLFLCHSRKTSSAKKHITYRSCHPLPEMVVRSRSRIIASSQQSRSRKSARDHKWNFCLTGASRTDHRRVFRRPPEELVHPLRRLAGWSTSIVSRGARRRKNNLPIRRGRRCLVILLSQLMDTPFGRAGRY